MVGNFQILHRGPKIRSMFNAFIYAIAQLGNEYFRLLLH